VIPASARLAAIEQEQVEAKKRDEAYKARQLSNERVMVGLTSALVVVGFSGIAISIWQTQIADTSANAAKSAAESAVGSLVETRRGLAQAEGLTNLSLGQTERLTRESLEETRKATSVADRSAKAAEGANNLALLNARAWVGPTVINMEPWKPGSPITISITFKNSGSTPAFNVRIRGRWALREPGQQLLPTYPADSVEREWGALFPEVLAHVPYEVPATPDLIERLKLGTTILYLYGRITYEEASRQRDPWTTFCYQLLRDSTVGPCGAYNDAR